MSTTSQRHSLPTRTTSLTITSLPGRPAERRAQPAHEAPFLPSLMGPPNRAPGVSIMGAPGQSPHPVMGRPYIGPRLSVMGVGDAGTPINLFGESDPRSVDSLFTPRGSRLPAGATLNAT